MYNNLSLMIGLIKNFFKENRKIILFTGLFIFVFMMFSDSAFADDFTETKNKFIDVTRWITTIITVFLSLMTFLTTMFLSPEWINGNIFWLNSYFKDIWVLVSNFVYLIFAFILIWIAFMNIIWKWWDKYQLKQTLPKFIVWVLIVPFSWFIVQFILSLSAILTVSALNLPFETFSSFNTTLWQVDIPNSCHLNLKADTEKKTSSVEETDNTGKGFFYCDVGKTTSLETALGMWTSWDSIYWIMWTYVYWVLDLSSIDQITIEWNYSTIADIIVKIIFDLLFIVIFSILLIALWLVLMVRGIYIWIYIMISPIFWLMYFFDKSEWWWEFFDKFNIKNFISLTMVPVYAMLALSFGLLFMFVVGQWMQKSNNVDLPQWITFEDNGVVNGVNTSVIGLWTDDKKFTLEFIWSPVNVSNVTWFVSKVWWWTMSVIAVIIMKIFSVVLLWWTLMAALRSSEVTSAIVEPLHQFGGQVWSLVSKSPQYVPIFGGQSMTSINTAGSSVVWQIDTLQRWKGTKFAQDNFAWLYSDESIEAQQRINHIEWAISWWDNWKIYDELQKSHSLWKTDDIVKNKKLLDAIASWLDKIWTNSKYWFKDKEKLKDITDRIRNSTSGSSLRQAYVDLDGLSNTSDYSWLAWDTIVTSTNDVDKYMWNNNKEANSYSSNINLTMNNTTNWLESKWKNIVGISDVDKYIESVNFDNDELSKLTKEDFITKLSSELIDNNGKSYLEEKTAKDISEKVFDALDKRVNFKED